jgi:release factor glutamine methyltransferase
VTTIAEALAEGRRRLAANDIDNPGLDARLLLAAASGLTTSHLLARGDADLPEAAHEGFRAMIARRAAGEPVARILGEKEFWGMPFRLTPATLVPRPDTEILVEAALAAVRSRRLPDDLTFCDLGTGSGAIALALLRELPRARAVATDISAEALSAAKANAESLGLADRIEFILADFAVGPEGPFHLVVSNPPYIRSGDLAALPREVRDHDPALALDGGADGLEPYRALASRLPGLIFAGGIAIFEVGDGQSDAVSALLAAAGLVHLETRADLGGTARIVVAMRQSARLPTGG